MKRVLVIIAIIGLASTAAFADDLGVNFSAPGYINGPSQWSLGYEFIANGSISITGLGAYDDGSSSGGEAQQVGLWDADGNLLASTFVSSSDPLTDDFWRFNAITSVTLVSGDTYYVASQGGWDYTYYTSGFEVDPDITYVQDAYGEVGTQSNSPLVFPSETENVTASDGGAFFGGNIELGTMTPTPEPGSLLLLGSGLATMLAAMRRKFARG
ncbi:MAG: DUF4082 domain-containing protein [Terracidiphilus sp.]|jgi:hypothetical protein